MAEKVQKMTALGEPVRRRRGRGPRVQRERLHTTLPTDVVNDLYTWGEGEASRAICELHSVYKGMPPRVLHRLTELGPRGYRLLEQFLDGHRTVSAIPERLTQT